MVLDQSAMVILLPTIGLQGFHKLHNLGGNGNGGINFHGKITYINQVLGMHPDGSSRLEITLQNQGHFCIQYCTSCQSSPDGLIDLFCIHTSFFGKNHGLRHGREMNGYHDLVGKFTYISASYLTQ